MSDEPSQINPIDLGAGRLSIPSEMVAEIASGLEDPTDIAFRYGIVGEAWRELQKWVPFQNAVAAQKAEFEKTGFTFKVKARMLTEDVFDDAYRIARSNASTLVQKLEFIKVGAKLADMEPKTNQQTVAGPGFSITINLGDSPKPVMKDITVETKEEKVHETLITDEADEPNVYTTSERKELSSE
jgi:hypothetical protein